MENKTNTIKNELSQFTGTENYYRYHNLLLTDGTYYLAQTTAPAFGQADGFQGLEG